MTTTNGVRDGGLARKLAFLAGIALPYALLVAGPVGCSSADKPPLLGDDDASVTSVEAPDSGAVTAGDGTGDGGAAGTCSIPAEACPCATTGATYGCGEVVRRSGTYVTCSIGQRTCTAGKWSACIGDSVATKALLDDVVGETKDTTP